MDDREFQDSLLPKMVQLNVEPLDPNVIAAYVAGEIPDAEYAEVEARIARDPEALMLVNALRADVARPLVTPWRVAAVAAAVLLAFFGWRAFDERTQPASFDSQLAAAQSDLTRRYPKLFGDFTVLSADELRATESVARGGARWIGPRGVLLRTPRELRWANPPGATRVEVSLRGEGFRWKREVEGAEQVEAPALEPGRYVVRLRGLDSLAGQEIRRSFTVASASERQRFQQGLAMITSRAPSGVAQVLEAHYALRARLFDEAREAAIDAREHGGDAAAAAEAVLAHLDALAR